MKKYITIYPFVYINIQDSNTLFYNTLSGQSKIFNNDEYIAHFAISLVENNYACLLEDEQINSLTQTNFFNLLIENNFGYYVDVEKLPVLPFSTQCIDINNDRLVSNFKNNENILENIREITFYLNNFSSIETHSKLQKAHYQFLFPIYEKEKKELNLTHIKAILNKIENQPVNINIIGGNIFEYSNYQELINELNNSWHNVFYYFHYSDFINIESANLLSDIHDKTIKVMLIDFPFVRNELVKWDEVIKQHIQKVEFIIENEDQLTEAEKIILEYEIQDYMFRPYYNGINLDFFKENVFLNEEDILEVKESLFELTAKKISNPAFFGKFIINADGEIYTSFNFPPVGNISELNIKNIIFHLLEDENSSWRVNKTVIEPCKDCIYNILCPPISNYDYFMNKHNLCAVK